MKKHKKCDIELNSGKQNDNSHAKKKKVENVSKINTKTSKSKSLKRTKEVEHHHKNNPQTKKKSKESEYFAKQKCKETIANPSSKLSLKEKVLKQCSSKSDTPHTKVSGTHHKQSISDVQQSGTERSGSKRKAKNNKSCTSTPKNKAIASASSPMKCATAATSSNDIHAILTQFEYKKSPAKHAQSDSHSKPSLRKKSHISGSVVAKKSTSGKSVARGKSSVVEHMDDDDGSSDSDSSDWEEVEGKGNAPIICDIFGMLVTEICS